MYVRVQVPISMEMLWSMAATMQWQCMYLFRLHVLETCLLFSNATRMLTRA